MKILRIHAIWCSGCLVMRSIWRELEKEYPMFIYEDYDYDMDEDVVKQWEVGTTIPVVIFLDDNNQEIKRLIGEKSKKEIIKAIEEVLQ